MVHLKNYIFTHFYFQYLVLLTMVIINISRSEEQGGCTAVVQKKVNIKRREDILEYLVQVQLHACTAVLLLLL